MAALMTSVAVVATAAAGAHAFGAGHRCRADRLRLGHGPFVSAATGQNPFVFRLTNGGTKRCWLKGFPSVALANSRGRAQPFVITHRGDQMVRAVVPRTVWLRPNRSAFFMLNKYRCDLGFSRAQLIRQVRVRIPGRIRRRTLTLTLRRWPQIGYCGRGDAGSTVAVSPFVGSRRALFQR